MTRKKKIIISAVAAALAISVTLTAVLLLINRIEPFRGVQRYSETVLFSSSFEDDETRLAENLEESGLTVNVSAKTGGTGMTTSRSSGPKYSWGGISKTGWTGERALEINGIHNGHGEASCSNVIFPNLGIPVGEGTHLSYVIYPSTLSDDSYDYEYTGMYICVDAVFTDGTRLSELGATDQNGFLLDPVSQGESDALYTNQWNYIRADIGSVAAGKTIDRLLISYSKPDNGNAGDSEFLTYVDDVTLSDITGMEYDHLADYVDIRRGSNSTSTFSRGLISPAVTYPNGFNFFTPVTDSGNNLQYYYHLAGERNTLSSISIEHIASYWVGDYGTWQFMPSTFINAGSVKDAAVLGSAEREAQFTHSDEIATCYYYSVKFAEDSRAAGVTVEVTPTMYGAVVRFTFPEDSDNRSIIFDSENGGGALKFDEDSGTFTAYSNDINNSSRTMYVYGRFSVPAESTAVFGERGAVSFPEGTDTVEMTLATSFINYEQAEKNYGYDFKKTSDFDKVCAVARNVWDEALGVVEIEGATYTQMVTYYSCLYRVLAYPTLYTENTGTEKDEVWQYASPYSGSTMRPKVKDGALVCNTGLWDTYRTAWPWYFTYSKDPTLINGLLQHYIDSGWNGAWICVNGFQCMIGTHSDIIYADGTVKGLRYDYSTAMMSMLRNAATVRNKGGVGREEQETSVFTGYVTNAIPRGLSWTLDNSLNDFGLYVMADYLGMTDEAAYYKNRAKAYVTVFNEELGFFVGKDANGNWSRNKSNFSPADWTDDYTESNAWNMAFNMVYDVGGMASLYGGADALAAKLDEFFATEITNVDRNSIHEVRESREVRLGQYSHANQVAHHIAYLYDFVGQPYKTQEIVRSVLARCYVGAEIGQGYVGDEDNGEQSAWYVYSALGFYPTALATGQYTIGSPLFPKVTLHLETGDVTITAENNSTENVYIASCKVNGEAYDKTYITQEMLDSGADIVFKMTDSPTAWGTSEDSRPYSLTPYGEDAGYLTDTTGEAKVSAGGADGNSLTDDTSDTCASFGSSNAQITFEYQTGKRVQIVTLTSAKANTPTIDRYTLEASADGVNFVTLDEREDIEFEWAQYTRPFLIPEEKQGEYIVYRITLESREQELKIAETELIG